MTVLMKDLWAYQLVIDLANELVLWEGCLVHKVIQHLDHYLVQSFRNIY